MAWRCSAQSNAALCENLASAGIVSRGPLLTALVATDRGHFFPPGLAANVIYQDAPHPIGFGATISAPHMHAGVVEALSSKLVPGSRVLDVGSGTGILLGVFARLVCGADGGKVVGVEHVPELARSSLANLRESAAAGGGVLAAALARGCVEVVVGDGRAGYSPAGPYDAIHVGAAAPTLPPALVEQLAPGGVLIIPVGEKEQELLEVTKGADGRVVQRVLMGVRYVPLTDLRHQLQ
jgi:protein-L-isoaspartate(D-aspartate) O-methyltransferase